MKNYTKHINEGAQTPESEVIFMPFKTGQWGPQAQARAKKRSKYFSELRIAKKANKFQPVDTIGRVGESIADQWLTSGKLVNESDFDLDYLRVKVEVKCSSRGRAGNWVFSIPKHQRQNSDYIMLICLRKNSVRPQRIYFIPSSEINIMTLSMGPENQLKYAQWKL